MRSAAVILGVVALALPASLAVPSSAAAKPRVFVPPGNSAASQYVEVVPTASGGRPTSSIHATPGGAGSGGGNSSGGASGSSTRSGSGSGSSITSDSGSSSATGSASPVSRSTQRKLDSLGASGRAAAALAQATAPPQASAPKIDLAIGSGGSPTSALLRAVAGSSGSGGLGVLLPVILIGSLVGAAALAVVRRRGGSRGSA